MKRPDNIIMTGIVLLATVVASSLMAAMPVLFINNVILKPLIGIPSMSFEVAVIYGCIFVAGVLVGLKTYDSRKSKNDSN